VSGVATGGSTGEEAHVDLAVHTCLYARYGTPIQFALHMKKFAAVLDKDKQPYHSPCCLEDNYEKKPIFPRFFSYFLFDLISLLRFLLLIPDFVV
jgi:hypothetical protein